MSSVTPAVADVVSAVGARLMKEAPALINSQRGVELQNPAKRLSIGVTKSEGQTIATLFVEKKDSWAMRQAKKIEQSIDGPLAINITGVAHSTWPQHPVSQINALDLRPGLSIGHYCGYAGTLGCILRIKSSHGEILSLAGASHVLAMINTANRGDAILQPGYPDGQKILTNRIGVITNYTYLVHYEESLAYGQSANTEDIAVVQLDDQQHWPSANLVPDPRDPKNKKIKLKGYLSDEELIARINERVFKMGRTTEFTEGVYHGVIAGPQAIELPDRKVYLYKNVFMVKNKGMQAFSQPGDSGSLVYTLDGKAIGMIIGASDQITYLSPMSSCLKSMNADLLI